MGCAEVVRYLTRHGSRRIARAVLVATITPFTLKTADNPEGVEREKLEQGRRALSRDCPHQIATAASGFFGAPKNPVSAGIMEWWWEGMCVEGSPESEIHPDIAPLSNEKVISKHRYSAFYNTDLETILRVQKIEDVVIAGTMTNMCCESTARDAYYRDYRVFFLADGTGSINEEMHLASLLNLAFGFAWVTNVDTVLTQLGEQG